MTKLKFDIIVSPFEWYDGQLVDLVRKGKTVIIKILMGKRGLTKENFDLWLGILLHELGHAYYYLSQKDWEYQVLKTKLHRLTSEEEIQQEIEAWKFSLSFMYTLRNFALLVICLSAYYAYYSGHPYSFPLIRKLIREVEKIPKEGLE